MTLDEYRAKRDFAATPEPEPEPAAADEPSRHTPRFVVQEHHARRLHWDLRLEHDGVLVSWAVPKGVPPDPKVNHLAVHTEDHPLSYIDFEGEIPRGNYGAGSMTVWDTGTYECIKFESAEVMVDLHGQRVQGRYVLFRTDKDQWMIHRMDPPQDPTREPMPTGVEPMRATPGKLPEDDAHAYEILWDGVRTVVAGEGGTIHDGVTERFPELSRIGRALGAREVVLDGEVVALGEDGRPDRGRLDRRRAGSRADAIPVTYMIYDLLYLDGHTTMHRPYTERRELLEGLDLTGFHWQTPSNHVGDGAGILAVAREQGLPGIVAKRRDSPYRPGEQSADWVEVRAG
ncbi:MAG: DNA polymerase ligase N-terminal domain-containing protein [Acidimicrobiales bacterium]